MSRSVLSIVPLALGLLCEIFCVDPAVAGRRVALVIGNSAYQHAVALPNPTTDTEAMAAKFQKAGFDVVSAWHDVGNLEFKRAIQLFEKEAADSDIAVVYYAGHGIEIQGINYLIPVDATFANDRDAQDEAITLERLGKSVDGAKRLRLVILDVCGDNPFARTRKYQRTTARRQGNPGLAGVEPNTDTLIAYAARAGSEAEDCHAEDSPFTTALVHNLFVPGLDIRFAFGRVLAEVFKRTGNRQEPFVYGKLRRLGVIALVPPPIGLPPVDLMGEKIDYNIVEKIGKEQAWIVFLALHPTGFYSDQARQQITKLRIAVAEQPKGSTPELRRSTKDMQEAACKDEEDLLRSLRAGGSKAIDELKQLEQELTCERLLPLVIAALDRANTMYNINAPELVRAAQQELNRLGCFFGAVDGSLNAPTKAAVQRYQNDRGIKPSGDVEITDEFVSELKKQSGRVCPLVCMVGMIAEGEHCVDAKKAKPIVRRKDEDVTPAKQGHVKQEEKSTRRHETTPRVKEQPSGAGGHGSTIIGVGF